MRYLKNQITDEIVKGSDFGPNFYDWIECTQLEIDTLEFENERQEKIYGRIIYLASTDWELIKSVDIDVEYSQEIKDKRILARQEINEIEIATDLSSYSIDFN